MNKEASNVGSLAAFALGGAGIGVGARLAKNMMDLYRSGSEEGINIEPKSEAPVIPVNVEVSKEEAAELAKNGVKVKRVLRKKADSSLIGNALLGATGAAGIGGGWYLVDKLLNKNRKQVAQEEVQELRDRVKKVLEDEPQGLDVPIHASMKAAEAHYFAKEAEWTGSFGTLDSIAGNLPTPLQYGMGGAALLAAVSAYKAMKNNKSDQKVKAIQVALRDRAATTPKAVMEPVVVEDAPGSPAQQASEQNKVV